MFFCNPDKCELSIRIRLQTWVIEIVHSFSSITDNRHIHAGGGPDRYRTREVDREVFDLVLGVRVAIAGPGERPRELGDRPRLDIKWQRNWDKKLNGGKKAVASQDHEYLITTDMSLYTQVPNIYGMYPQGYQRSLSDKELISLFLSSKEKYHILKSTSNCSL